MRVWNRWLTRAICQVSGPSKELQLPNREFSEYASSHWRSLVRSAVLLGSDMHEAEDLAQTTLMRCYVSWAKVVRATDRDAYVARVLINVSRQSRRRRWWQERPTAELPDTAEPDATANVDGTETVRQALAQLSQAHREVVVLRFYHHLSERQMADALGISPGCNVSRLRSAASSCQSTVGVSRRRAGISSSQLSAGLDRRSWSMSKRTRSTATQ